MFIHPNNPLTSGDPRPVRGAWPSVSEASINVHSPQPSGTPLAIKWSPEKRGYLSHGTQKEKEDED